MVPRAGRFSRSMSATTSEMRKRQVMRVPPKGYAVITPLRAYSKTLRGVRSTKEATTSSSTNGSKPRNLSEGPRTDARGAPVEGAGMSFVEGARGCGEGAGRGCKDEAAVGRGGSGTRWILRLLSVGVRGSNLSPKVVLRGPGTPATLLLGSPRRSRHLHAGCRSSAERTAFCHRSRTGEALDHGGSPLLRYPRRIAVQALLVGW
jgi:hypothetical protein